MVARQPCRVLDQCTPWPSADTVIMFLSQEESKCNHIGVYRVASAAMEILRVCFLCLCVVQSYAESLGVVLHREDQKNCIY